MPGTATRTRTKRTRTKPSRRASSGRRTTAKAASASKASGNGKYTKPELRARIKKKVTAGSKGGKAGQWSARKAQLVASEYKAGGGGYREGGKTRSQQHLDQWTNEEWTTSDGRRARRKGSTTRYLPKKAWSQLSASEKRATNRKKQTGSRKGKRVVTNAEPARRARRRTASK